MIIYEAKIVDIDYSQDPEISAPEGSKLTVTMQWNTANIGDKVLIVLLDS